MLNTTLKCVASCAAAQTRRRLHHLLAIHGVEVLECVACCAAAQARRRLHQLPAAHGVEVLECVACCAAAQARRRLHQLPAAHGVDVLECCFLYRCMDRRLCCSLMRVLGHGERAATRGPGRRVWTACLALHDSKCPRCIEIEWTQCLNFDLGCARIKTVPIPSSYCVTGILRVRAFTSAHHSSRHWRLRCQTLTAPVTQT